MTPSRYLLLLGLVSIFALLGVAQSTCATRLEYRVGQLEARRAELSDENRRLLCDIYALSYPARIAGEVGRLNIELTDPVELSKSLKAATPASGRVRR